MFDVFYFGPKPNLFEFEKPADSLEDAAGKSRTLYYWYIYGDNDFTEFDFDFVPAPWENEHVHVWPSQWHQYGGVYLANKNTVHDLRWQFRNQIVKTKSNRNNWQILHPIYEDRFDWTWVPHPKDPPFIYVFGNQWHSPERMPTVEYHVPGATERKYMDMQATLLPNKTNWEKLATLSGFDYSWVPDPLEPPYIYVFGNQHYPGTIMPTLKYTVPGATQEKFVDAPIAKLAKSMANWEILEDIDLDAWDWSWVPNPRDPPYTYVFGNQWNPPEYKASVRYVVPGAIEVKYMDRRTQRLPQPKLFRFNIAVADFDYSWEPNPFDPPLTYVFGNQWNSAVLEPTVVYNVEGATEIKYIDDIIAQVAPDSTNWETLDEIESFDYSWRPNPTDPPYIYVFGNQWLTPEQRPAIQYHVPSATQIKYIDEPKAQRVGNPERFITHTDCKFDYSWEPDPGSPAYNYVFGNQWWPAEVMPTVEYGMPGATETKFVSEPSAKLLEHHDHHWHTLVDCEWDYSWQPDPGDPPLIYVWGNQHWPAVKMPTVEYHVAGATERKYMDEPVAKLLSDKSLWSVPEEVDQANLDFSWVPDPGNDPYIYHFGTEHQMSVGLTYTVPGATELKFEGDIPRIVKEKRAVDVVDMFFVDRNNATSVARFDRLQAKYPGIQKIRYANSIMATIQRCVARAKTGKFWIVSSEYNYDQFDFTWHAQPWQSYMTHVFPSQHNKWSDTFLINKWEFERHSKWATGLEQFPNLNFVTNQAVTKPENLNNIYYVDHGNPASQEQYQLLSKKHPDIVLTRFVDNYLDTMKRIMSTAETEYVWIINSVCKYDYFDFTWQPEPWQAEMIHCFSSGLQKRGDTFYIHVHSFKQQMIELDLLDWFNVINYIETNLVERFELPVHYYATDDLITEVKNYKFETPYVFFTNQPELTAVGAPCLWTEKDRAVERCSASGASAMIPRDIKRHLRTQIYDYPYLETSNFQINEYYGDKVFPQLDIVFVSNGETKEQSCFEHLEYTSNSDVTWIKGVDGRTNALHAAARASTTPWFFCVPGKLRVDIKFDWFWKPDYWQGPKHYIFHAHNPVNGLEYGHQALVCYNKNLVLATTNPGLDFTMSQSTETVPILSGIAEFNTDAWQTWRTAFREVIKLLHFNATEPTLETEHRLNVWMTQAEGLFAEDCLKGAVDAATYYAATNGDYELLKLSYDWTWLKEFYNNKYQVNRSS